MDLAAGSNNYKSKRAFVFFFSLLFTNGHSDLFFIFFKYSPFLHLLKVVICASYCHLQTAIAY